MTKRLERPYWGIPFYLYMTGAYSRFLATGKCLRSPFCMNIQSKSLCNGRCSICPYRQVSRKFDPGTMEWNLFSRIVDQAASEPLLSRIVFELHNEPLLDQRTFDWLKYTRSRCPRKNLAIITNGALLDRFSLTDIKQSGLDALMISLNAHTRETYEKINKGLDYQRVMRNISRLLSDETLKDRVVLTFVVTRQNQEEIPRAVRHWESQGVRTEVRGLVNRAGTLDKYRASKSGDEHPGLPFMSMARDRVLDVIQRASGCPHVFYRMSVLYNGDVLLCCNDWNRDCVVGNLGTASLRETWNSDKWNSIRRLILRKRYGEVESCRGCSVGR